MSIPRALGQQKCAGKQVMQGGCERWVARVAEAGYAGRGRAFGGRPKGPDNQGPEAGRE